MLEETQAETPGVRRAVSALNRSGGWPQELIDYADGIRAMKALPPSDPLSLTYQAAIHGRNGEWAREHPDWDWCQHQSWFFLPWHRMYLLQFERIIGHLIHKPEWRLPYWDYTAVDEARWVLPTEFADPAADDNALWVDGRSSAPLPPDHRDPTTALEAPVFATEGAGFNFGSGMIAAPAQFGTAGETGALEGSPHNVIHMDVGGHMSDPTAAPLDPVFWLHHANVDRLWEVWLSQGEPRTNPTDASWLDTEFRFPDPSGDHVTWRVRDVLDTAALGYVYDDVAPPLTGVEDDRRGIAATVMTRQPQEPEVVGASDGPVSLEAGSSALIRMEEPRKRRGLHAGVGAEDAEDDVFLRVEGVQGTNVGVGVYGVYVGVPDGAAATAHPELKAGLLSTFGLEASSRGDGHGITQSFKITEIARALRAEGRWDPTALRVTFETETPGRALADGAENDVTAARVSVYYA